MGYRMTGEERFFFRHSGYCGRVNGTPAERMRDRVRNARDMARAVAYGEDAGWSFDLEPDEGFDWHGMEPDGADAGCCPWCNTPLNARGECGREHSVWGAVLRDADGHVLASVWGVVDPDRDYARLLHGELASEALHEIETRERNDREAPLYLAL